MPNFVPVTYSGGIPVLASNGAQRVACAHLAEWLQVYDALQVFRGRGHVAFLQTMGGADASAGTHLCGSAWDMVYTGTAPIMDAREMGAASWPRLHSNGWVGGEHVHSLIMCGDNSCNAYQYRAWLSGHNGLGLNGVGAGDTLPLPSTIRTWQDGIAWAQAQMGTTTAPTTPQKVTTMLRMAVTSATIPAETGVFAACLETGAFYHVPGDAAEADFDPILRGVPGVVDMGNVSQREMNVIRAMCHLASASIKTGI